MSAKRTNKIELKDELYEWNKKMSDLKKLIEYASLYDVYGALLTDKQRDIFELYYMKNLSSVEIGKQKNITRQGAIDFIAAAKKQLKLYERKLGFIKAQREKIANIKYALSKFRKDFDTDTFNKISEKILVYLR